MRECWLRPNRRVLVVAIAILILVALAVSALVVFLWRQDAHWTLGSILTLLAVLIWIRVVLLIVHVCQPRVAYQQEEVLLFLRAGRPIRVPVDVVECFFQQDQSQLQS